LRKRAIVVPRVNPVKEQWIRAERMAKLGLMRTIHPRDVTPSLLMKMVQEELAKINIHPRNLYQINLDGLSGVCGSISKLMDAKKKFTDTDALKQLTNKSKGLQQARPSRILKSVSK